MEITKRISAILQQFYDISITRIEQRTVKLAQWPEVINYLFQSDFSIFEDASLTTHKYYLGGELIC